MRAFSEFLIGLDWGAHGAAVLAAFVIACALALALRAVLCVGYQAQLTLFLLNAKEVKTPEAAKDAKSALFKRIAQDYIKTAERGRLGLPARPFAEKHVRRLNLLGWSYDSMARFLAAFGAGVLPCGILLAVVFAEYRAAYAAVTLIVFALSRLLENIFDYTLVKEKLLDELCAHTDREIGQFYMARADEAAVRMKAEADTSIAALRDVIAAAKAVTAPRAAAALAQEAAVKEQLDYIRQNQETLEKSLSKYEQSLSALTEKMGGGFGEVLRYYLNNTSETLNDSLETNIKTIINSNQDVIERLEALFARIQR